MRAKKNSYEGSSPENISWIFFLYRLLGFMPISGVFSGKRWNFSWKSISTVYSILTLSGFVFLIGLQMVRFCLFKVDMTEVVRLWYFTRAISVGIFFFHLAMSWKSFMERWHQMDSSMEGYERPKHLIKKVNIATAVFLFVFIVNYILNQARNIWDILIEHDIWSLKLWKHIQTHYKFPFVYQLLPYEFFSSVILTVVNFQVQVAGLLVDLFVIIISLLFDAKVQQIVGKVAEASRFNASLDQWIELREEYNKLASMCKYLNSKIGAAVFLSFAANLGMVIFSLFDNLTVNDLMGRIFTHYSFIFLLTRIVSVAILGGRINDHSRECLIHLYDSTESAYNTEIDRLIRQISRDDLALSGIGFFKVNRSLLLNIAGSIVTYELVVIQLAENYFTKRDIINSTYTLM